MQALKHGLERVIKDNAEEAEIDEPIIPVSEHMLQKIAEDWAVYCLRAHRNDLLQRGLAISAALTAYVDGVLHPETLKD